MKTENGTGSIPVCGTNNQNKSQVIRMATKVEVQSTEEPQTVEGKWLQFRRRFTTSIIVFTEDGLGWRAEYARTDLEFVKGQKGEWNWNWREEEVRKPHPKSEKRYFEDEDGRLFIKDGDLESKVLFKLPDEPCVVIERRAVQRGYNQYEIDEDVTSYGDVESLLEDGDHVSGVTYPIRSILYDADFRWDRTNKVYVRR